MSINFIISIIAAFFAFIIPSVSYKIFSSGNNPFADKNIKSIFLPFITSSLVISSVAYPFAYDKYDFLHSFNFIEMITPFLLAVLLFFSGKTSRTSKHFIILLLLASVICSFTIPTETVSSILPLPALCTRIIIFAACFLFSYLYRYANLGGATLGTQSVAIALGISVLGIIGAIPFFLGLLGMIITAGCFAIMVATYPPSNKTVPDNDASCLGFTLFALMLWTTGEQAAPCVAIFTLYFVTDFIWALLLRLTFIEQYSNIKENTAYRQAIAQGIAPQFATSFLCRAQILIIILGAFQAYNSQPHSLLLISTFIGIWLSYKMRNLSENNKTIKDLNKEVLEDLQARINNIKQYTNKEEGDQ